MTFGEKLAKLRKENNYTQEQLADILEVSRQSISKWESDIAYPETEKLVRIGKLFSCSMDYLLNDEILEKNGVNSTIPPSNDKESENILGFLRRHFKERKSEKTIFGMPLYHIGRNAHGFFAIGLKARGVFTIGLLSCGVCSLGLLSFGVLAIGVLALGLISLGTFAFGLLAVGSIAFGLYTISCVNESVAQRSNLNYIALNVELRNNCVHWSMILVS